MLIGKLLLERMRKLKDYCVNRLYSAYDYAAEECLRPPDYGSGKRFYVVGIVVCIYLIGVIVRTYSNVVNGKIVPADFLYIVYALNNLCYLLLSANNSILISLYDRLNGVYTYRDVYLRSIARRYDCRAKIKRNSLILTTLIYSLLIVQLIDPLLIIAFTPMINRNDYREYFTFDMWNPFRTDRTMSKLFILYAAQVTVRTCSAIILCDIVRIYYYVDRCIRCEIRSLSGIMTEIDYLVSERTKHLKPDDRIVGGRRQFYYNRRNLYRKAQDEIFLSLIMECHSHHRSIVRYTGDLIRCYRWIYAMYYLSTFINASAGVYNLISSGDFFADHLFEVLSSCCFCNAVLYFMCYSAEIYLSINEIFLNAIYQTVWYERSIAVQKTMLTMLSTINWRLQLAFTPTNYLSHKFYTTTVKALYDFINFLRTLYG